MRAETRHKAIIVPVTPDKKFLTVRDSRHQEWIFVTGGCKKTEIDDPIKCALRELEEETRGVINIKNGSFTYFSFESTARSPEELRKDTSEGLVVTLMYHVFLVKINVNEEKQMQIIKAFRAAKAIMEYNKTHFMKVKKAYDENDDLSFDTLDEFNKKKQWNLISSNVIRNHKFYTCLSSLFAGQSSEF